MTSVKLVKQYFSILLEGGSISNPPQGIAGGQAHALLIKHWARSRSLRREEQIESTLIPSHLSAPAGSLPPPVWCLRL